MSLINSSFYAMSTYDVILSGYYGDSITLFDILCVDMYLAHYSEFV